ncbi:MULTISPECIES: glutathione peroxidase [Loigolactobacillus]|uniref:Glutathione peroxidase n=1 Tax=Loigolactobacillus backii TaxID=375175 RepID=A0A192H008_9LACO|nr:MULTISPECIES: glutathione peroxidase [Loigolactobacillus]ANK60816.1 glutathione peroxidase [Loigolactobacillus backii]ANK61613.1 glutathione peroxidase [Loigolactobacillus backii]ANK65770.1 glutathione peroxidase [Loigolactobacillus backii]ANK68246.1 glutathione peroxidase [Loigolactobacillus backii]ANK69187.1 glutathione peroxidase [Loigolactobacillus backii]
MSIYDYTVTEMNGQQVSMAKYRGKIVVIVNTASKCGLAPQLKSLEKIYEDYHDDPVTVLGFPSNQFLQELKDNAEIDDYCALNYGVTFTMHKKIHVNGKNTEPLFQYLKDETDHKRIKWNFTKFLIDGSGNVVKRYEPTTKPDKIRPDIKRLLADEHVNS